MVVLCGTDVVYIPRVRKFVEKPDLLKRFFHLSELENKDVEHLAGIIAVKEAFFKALGCVPKFDEVKVEYESSGKPKIVASSEFSQYERCDVSISHDCDYAIAVVVVER